MAVDARAIPSARTAPSGVLWQWAAFLASSFGIGAFNAFNAFTLPLWLSGYTASYVLIGLLSNGRSFEGALVSPLTCAWSDRIWLGWLGRRRPFILAGGLATGLLMAVTPALAGLAGGAVAPIVAITAGIFLFTLSFNAMDDVHRTLMADMAEGAARTRLAGLHVVMAALGQVVVLFGGSVAWREAVPDWAFALSGALVVLGALATVLGVRETPDTAATASARTTGLWEALGAVRHLGRPAVLFCLVNLLYWTGASAILPLLPLFTRDVLGGTVGQAQLLPGLLLLASTLCAMPTVWLANRYGKRRVLAIGYGLVMLSAVAGLVVVDVPQAMSVFFLAGVGTAAVLVLPLPLLVELVPRDRAGAAVGVLSGGTSIAAPLASLVAGAVAEQLGLRAVFLVVLVFVVAAALLLPATERRSTEPD